MRRFITALALAAALAVTTVASFASVVYDNNGDSESNGGGNGGGSVVSTTTYNAGTAAPAATVAAPGTNVTAPNGETLNLEGAGVSNEGITSGLVENRGDDAFAAEGEAKTAGLPESVINVINQLDSGYLGGVPGVDTTGLTAYGKTVAVRTETADRTAMLYASQLPANPRVLIYNNNTGVWMILPANNVNRANNTLTYEAPAGCDGQTAIIIG